MSRAIVLAVIAALAAGQQAVAVDDAVLDGPVPAAMQVPTLDRRGMALLALLLCAASFLIFRRG